MLRKPDKKELIFLLLVVIFYLSAILYVYIKNLSFSSLFYYGLLQPRGITGEDVRLVEIEAPLSWNILQVLWYIYIKACAVHVDIFNYWVIGMFIAAALVVFVPWGEVREKMGYGGFKANLLAATAGAVIPICSCGIVPVLAGMVEAGIPLGPVMAFLIAAPMLNIPAFFITAGVLGWPLAVGRVLGTFGIALSVAYFISKWQRKDRFLRRLVKLNIAPRLSPELQQFAFEVAMKLMKHPEGLTTKELAPGKEDKLYLLGEAGILDKNRNGRWYLPATTEMSDGATGACMVLPRGDMKRKFPERLRDTITTAWDLFLQLNYYLVLAVLIAGAIKVLIPTKAVVSLVGGESLNSVIISSFVALLAYVCTYVEIPTALALIQKGMGGGATLAYLLGGPGLSLPSIIMLSGVFKPKVLGLYVSLSFIGCIIAGYVFNLFF